MSVRFGELLRRRRYLREEVALADDAGAGATVFEVSDLLLPSGTDLSADGHVLGTVVFEPGQICLVSCYVDIPGDFFDSLFFGEFSDPADAWDSSNNGVALTGLATPAVGRFYDFQAGAHSVQKGQTLQDTTPDEALTTWHIGFATAEPLNADLLIAYARAAFLLI